MKTQGFRKNNNEKLRVRLIDAYVYHYGWVKDPYAMQRKQVSFNKLWHDDEWIKNHVPDVELFDYKNINSLNRFKESHPEVMRKRIQEKNWNFEFALENNKYSLKEKFKRMVEKLTGYRIGEYKNYKFLR